MEEYFADLPEHQYRNGIHKLEDRSKLKNLLNNRIDPMRHMKLQS